MEASKITEFEDIASCRPEERKNVFGVVRDCAPPKRTKNEDWIVVCKIADHSVPDTPLSVNLFFAPSADAPKIHIGMILRLHRMKIEARPTGLSGVGYKGTFSVFDGSIGGSNAPLYHWSPNTASQLTEAERFRVNGLREWAAQIGVLNTPFLKSIAEFPLQTNADLIAKVIQGTGRSADQYGKCIVWVWDGTHNPHCKITQSSEQPPSSLMQVEVYGDHVNSILEFQPSAPINTWFKFRNVKGKIWDNNLIVSTSAYSSILKLRDDDPYVKGVLSRYQQRKEELMKGNSKQNAQPVAAQPVSSAPPLITRAPSLTTPAVVAQPPPALFTSLVPPTQVLHDANRTDIRSILSHRSVPWKFCCLARMVSFYPQDTREWTQPRCPECNSQCSRSLQAGRARYDCDMCSSAVTSPRFVYRLRVQLQDATGRMVALLCDKNARDFFLLDPSELYENNVSHGMLARKMKQLQETQVLTPFCLQSYVPEGSAESKYQIFDTHLTI